MKRQNSIPKPKFMATMVGFLITVLLITLLLPTSILLGLKTGFLKDSSIEGIAKQLDISGYAAELIPDIIQTELDSDEIDTDAIVDCIPEDLIEDFTDEVISCISNGDNIEIEFFDDYYEDIATNTSKEITNFLMDELVSQAGDDAYITKEQIQNIDVFQEYSKTYETELDSVFTSYGDGTGIAIDDIKDNEKVQTEISNHLKPVITTTLQTTLETTIDDFNEQLGSTSNEVSDVNKMLNMGMKYVTIATVVLVGLCVLLMVVMLINYHGFLNHALKNNGIAFLLSGLFATFVGLASTVGVEFLFKQFEDELKSGDVSVNIVEDLLFNATNAIFTPIRNIGFIFLIVAVIMLVLAKIVKKSKQSRAVDMYE